MPSVGLSVASLSPFRSRRCGGFVRPRLCVAFFGLVLVLVWCLPVLVAVVSFGFAFAPVLVAVVSSGFGSRLAFVKAKRHLS